MIKAALSFPII